MRPHPISAQVKFAKNLANAQGVYSNFYGTRIIVSEKICRLLHSLTFAIKRKKDIKIISVFLPTESVYPRY